MKEFKRYLNVP